MDRTACDIADPATGPAEEQCLTLSEAPPDPARMDVLAVLEHCSARHPTDVELMAELGPVYNGWQPVPPSRKRCIAARLSVDPGDGDLRLRLGRLLLKRGDANGRAPRAEAGSPSSQTVGRSRSPAGRGGALMQDGP